MHSINEVLLHFRSRTRFPLPCDESLGLLQSFVVFAERA